MPRRKPETKRIGGVWHVRVLCVLCKGMCWTQRGKKLPTLYACHTCTEPKLMGVGRGDG